MIALLKGKFVNLHAATRLSLDVRIETWRLTSPIRITGYTFDVHEALVVTLSD